MIILKTEISLLQVIRDDVIGDDEMTSRDVDAVSASGDWPSRATPPTRGTSIRHLAASTSTMMRCVRSYSDVSTDVDDDVTPPLSELYSHLREVLHENARLKILLWGNKMNPCMFESPVARFKT